MAKSKYYITTAIAYPNGKPHLGHALEIVQADVLARFYKLLGKDVFFQTGTDEHGIKNWRTAQKEGKDIQIFLDENVACFKDLYAQLSIAYDSFLRTSDKKAHYEGAKRLWGKLVAAGDIYKKSYKGIYCVGCESYKTEKELVENKCPNHPNKELETIEEENYFFKLSKYKEEVAKLIQSDTYKVVPNVRKNEILSFLKEAEDISFSRTKDALPWGIPVPNDEDHVMYVWCDALSNYITGIGYEQEGEQFKSAWPADIHVIGKDILKFHAAFWPAMLLSAKIELPKELFVHGFLNIGGLKMGKSTGNVIDPFDQIKQYGTDPFRFYLIGAMPITGDGDYTEDLIIERINKELVGNISNFCYRSLSFTNKNLDSKIVDFNKDESVVKEIVAKFASVKEAYESRDLKKALGEILEISALGNKFMQENEPWKNRDKAPEILSLCLNIVKNLTILISPIVPGYAKGIRTQLNVKDLTWDDLNFDLTNHTINQPEILLTNVQKEEVVEEEKKTGFSLLNLKVAEILEVKPHPDADKLLVMQIDLGEKRQLVAGLRAYYSPEDLIGKKIVVVSNLEPAKLRGEKSEGMLLAAGEDTDVGLLLVKDAKPGDQVTISGAKPNSKLINYKDFLTVKIEGKNGKAFSEGKVLTANSEEVFVDKNITGKVK
jgi:methionyl-tRNA synthetase